MSKQTEVAVITRTKDRPVLLERALLSVHGQSYKNFLHVIINDGGNRNVVDDLLERHKELVAGKILLIHNGESHGMEAASNTAIGSVDSEFIAIHDDDDTWHPDFLQQMTDRLNETSAMGAVARTDKVVEELQTDGSATHLKTSPWMPDLKAVSIYRQCIDNQMTPITFLYRREAYDQVGGYDETLPVCGDWDFGIKFLQKYDVEYVDPGFALANYHHRSYKPGAEGNSSYAGNDKHRYWTNYLMNKYLREELAEGRVGVGYIMSKLRYDEANTARLARSIMPKFAVEFLKKRARD